MNKIVENLKQWFNTFTNYQKCAVLALTLIVPLTAILGVSAINEYTNIKSVQANIHANSFDLYDKLNSTMFVLTEKEVVESKIVEVKLSASSIEEDLEVLILNQKDEMIVDVEFTLTVTSADGSYNKEWPVNDGMLSLTKLKAGDYVVSIAPLEGYNMPEQVECKVEKKVVYEKQDVSDKVVDDSTVDSSKEDSEFGSGSTQTPPPSTDTVEYVESKTEVVKKETEVITIKHLPVLLADGTMQAPSGASSGLYPEVDAQGYLTGAYMLQTVSRQNLAQSKGFSLKNTVNTVNNHNGVLLLTEGQDLINALTTEEPIPTTEVSPTPDVSPSADPSPSVEPTPSPSVEPTPSPSIEPTPTPSPTKVPVTIFDANGNIVTDSAGAPLIVTQRVEVVSVVTEEVTMYYGWQTFNGKRYYYDKNGNKITGTHTIQGITYFFDSNGVMSDRMGIDVSKYQPNIDWNAVKASGIEFVIIRVGYRGYSTGVLVEDPYFRKHIQGATAAGLKVGVYFFTQAITTQEAVEEASMVLDAVKGYNLAYPIYFDTEHVGNGARADNLSKSHRTSIAKAFCETIQNSGYRAGVYASKSWFYNQLEFSQISQYSIWVAHYAASTDFKYNYDIWQYTGTGSCPGVAGAVDLNIGYKAF